MTDDPAVRVEALEALLVEKGLVDPELVDEVIEHYETNVGPLNGAKVVARAWAEPAFHDRLLADGTAAIAEMGYGGARGPPPRRGGEHARGPQRRRLHAVLVLPVAGARPAAGLVQVARVPLARRRPAPRGAGRDGPGARRRRRVRVWDCSAEARYMVVPERPAGTEGLGPEELERAGHARRDDRRGPGAGARCLTRSPTTSRRTVSPPRNNGEIVFAAPWERRAFGLTVACAARSAATGRPSANA